MIDELLAREADLQRLAEEGKGLREFGWVWSAPAPAVILGRSTPDSYVDLEACARAHVPVVRRESGGGAVVLGPGCLNYTLVLSCELHPHLREVSGSYRHILGAVAAATGAPNLRIEESDLVLGDQKCGGCAQRRMRHTVLHHGTLLFDFNPDLAELFLRTPAKQPAYRRGRRHRDFLTNIDLPEDFAEALAKHFPDATIVE
jgi:lipoate-protein ligase A